MSLPNTPERFWSRVRIGKKNECWPWKGARNSGGYGTISWHGDHAQVHRIAWMLTHGGIRPLTNFRHVGVAKRYKRFVLHSCDNTLCCNPKHLFLGSMRVNQLDAYKKGRKIQPRGAHHANAKLTTKQAAKIRKIYGAGGIVRQVDLAALYGVSQTVISHLIREETYK